MAVQQWRDAACNPHSGRLDFAVVPDPVGAGYADSLAHPGGNATGFAQFEYGIAGKWLELLIDIFAPRVKRQAFFVTHHNRWSGSIEPFSPVLFIRLERR